MMDNPASQALVVSEEVQVQQWLIALECPANIAGRLAPLLLHYWDGAAQVTASSPVYLRLPAALAAVEADPRYMACLPFGRFWYRDAMSQAIEGQGGVRCLAPHTREEIGEFLRSQVCPPDPRYVAVVPLASRVGFAVGWLSGLAVSQKEDAQAGMVMLAALVAPLLLSAAAPGQAVPKQIAAPGSRSRRSNRSVL